MNRLFFPLLAVVLLALPQLRFTRFPNQKTFEGMIIYDVKIIDKNASSATLARWHSQYGTQIKIYIKGKNIKEEYYENSLLIREVYYTASEQKIYVQKLNAAALEAIDVSKEPNVLAETKNTFDKVDVLDVPCRTFIYAAQAPDIRLSPTRTVAGKTVLYRYLYPIEPQYAIHEELYAGYKLAFRENYYRRFNTLFMGYEYEDDEVMIMCSAAGILPQKLEETMFAIPKPAVAPAPSSIKAGAEPLNQQNTPSRKSGHE